MPKLKASPGTIKFTTVYPDEFQKYLFYELCNIRDWNKETVRIVQTWMGWECSTKEWSIFWDKQRRVITVNSKEPKIFLRKGLEILMGSKKLIIEADQK